MISDMIVSQWFRYFRVSGSGFWTKAQTLKYLFKQKTPDTKYQPKGDILYDMEMMQKVSGIYKKCIEHMFQVKEIEEFWSDFLFSVGVV